MSELNKIRLNKVIREFNISLERVVEFLSSKGHEIEARPTTKISQSQYDLLLAEFKSDRSSRVESHDLIEEKNKEKEELRIKFEEEQEQSAYRKDVEHSIDKTKTDPTAIQVGQFLTSSKLKLDKFRIPSIYL